MTYMLDTNIVIKILNGRNLKVLEKLKIIAPHDVFISTITVFELYYGAFKSGRPKQNLKILDQLKFNVLDFNTQDAVQAGNIRSELVKGGTPIGPFDVLLAGQARANDLILVTNNTREFIRVKDLQIKDWC